MPRLPTWAKPAARALATLSFVCVGIGHFTHTDFFVNIVPPSLPAPRLLVWLSGIGEVLGGLGLQLPRTRLWTSWGLIALLVAVFPANLYMAMNPEAFATLGFPAASLYARLPFQLVFIAWIYWVGRDVSTPIDARSRDEPPTT